MYWENSTRSRDCLDADEPCFTTIIHPLQIFMSDKTARPYPGLPFEGWPSTRIDIEATGTWPRSSHQFDAPSVWAVRAALATGRPLLLRGKPGMGKSQLARAVAAKLKVPFLSLVVDERTERDDLLFGYDPVARLAQAQVAGALSKSGVDWSMGLEENCFVRPGPLWWALDWGGARTQASIYSRDGRRCTEPSVPAGWTPEADRACGPVVLVDEIDKADASVPNGLLEAMANDGFRVEQPALEVSRKEGAKPPLVMITTNEERELPSAFLRRCWVLQMRFPEKRADAVTFLLGRARVHFGPGEVSDGMLTEIAEAFMTERGAAKAKSAYEPGPSEYLEVVRALVMMHSGKDLDQGAAFREIKEFAFGKHWVEGP